MEMEVNLTESVEPACFLSGKVTVNGKTAATVDFAVMLVENPVTRGGSPTTWEG